MSARDFDPARPIRVRLLSPLGLLPRHPVEARGARLIARDDLVVSAVEMKPSETHGIGLEHYSDLEFMALEEIRFLASISLAVPPADGMAYVYPLNTGIRCRARAPRWRRARAGAQVRRAVHGGGPAA